MKNHLNNSEKMTKRAQKTTYDEHFSRFFVRRLSISNELTLVEMKIWKRAENDNVHNNILKNV